MADLEVGNLGLVAGLNQGLEAGLDQVRDAATQDSLLAEQVGFGLLGEGRLDDAGAGAADGLRVGEDQIPGLAGGVHLDGDDVRGALALGVGLADLVAGTLGGDHDHIVTLGDLNVAVADVEAVCEEKGGTFLQVGGNLLGVHGALDLVGQQQRDDVALGDGLGHVLDLKARGLSLGPRRGTGAQADDHVNSGILQVQRVRVTLRTVTDDGNLLGLDQRQICAVVVDDFCHLSFLLQLIRDRA